MKKLIFLLLIVSSAFGQIRIKAVGDIMLGSITPKTILPPEDGKEFVKSIGTYLNNTDIVFGNLEGAIINDGMIANKCSEESRNAGRCYEFGMPEVLASSLKEMGFTILNLDNNHSEDYGEAGYKFTQQKLKELGINFSPKMDNAKLTVKDKEIIIAAFGYSGNSYDISNLELAGQIINKLNNDKNIIIVSFHGGAEGKDKTHVKDETEIFLGENRGNVYRFARTVIDAGADMVIGHGPHVLRTIDVYKGKLIAYSLGNFLTYGNMSINGISGVTAILQADIDADNGNLLFGKIIPVKQINRGIPVFDESFEAVNMIRRLNYFDFPESELIITEGGYFYKDIPLLPEIKGLEILSPVNNYDFKKYFHKVVISDYKFPED